MGQYTDKINQIAKDFEEIEYYEGVSSLLAQSGCMIVSYRHGGYKITAGDKGGSYNGYDLKPNEVKIIPSTDEYYCKLKKQYDGDATTLSEQLGNFKKRFNKFFGINKDTFRFRD